MTDLAKSLVERMTGSERDQSFADSEPRDSATLILIDRSGNEPKVLLGRRHRDHKFMPDKFVFPGGRIEALDRLMPAAKELHADAEAKLMVQVKEPSKELARAFALAAIRETCEEAGLLLGIKRDAPPPVPGDLWKPFAEAGVHPDLSQLHFVARAITPPRRPKRFDSRFFTADASAIAHRIEGVVSPTAELVELVWIPVSEATKLDMPTITAVVLEELAARVKAGMEHRLPVPMYFMKDDVFHRELL
ncbi:MAG TPA: NUDIX hydrolase [Pseudolabrys sp.]|nr:NUDIX hydrolase [Pseudolabrys sp.]